MTYSFIDWRTGITMSSTPDWDMVLQVCKERPHAEHFVVASDAPHQMAKELVWRGRGTRRPVTHPWFIEDWA